MRIFTRDESGKVQVGKSLAVQVLKIGTSSVKLGFALEGSNALASDSVDALCQVRSSCRGYYRFTPGRDRSLVLELEKGQRVVLNESEELVVLELRPAGVTMAICSGRECERFRENESLVDQDQVLPATYGANSEEQTRPSGC